MDLNNPPSLNSYVGRVSADTNNQTSMTQSQQVPAVGVSHMPSTPTTLEEPETTRENYRLAGHDTDNEVDNFILSDRALADVMPHTCGTTLLLDLGHTLDEIGRFVKSADTYWISSSLDLVKRPDMYSGWTIQGMRKFLTYAERQDVIVLQEGNQKKLLIVGFTNPLLARAHFMKGDALNLDHLHWRRGGYNPFEQFEPMDDVDLLLGGFGKGKKSKGVAIELPCYGWSSDDVKENARFEFEKSKRKEKQKWIERMIARPKKDAREKTKYKASSGTVDFALDSLGIMAEITSLVLSIRGYIKHQDKELLASAILQVFVMLKDVPDLYRFMRRVCKITSDVVTVDEVSEILNETKTFDPPLQVHFMDELMREAKTIQIDKGYAGTEYISSAKKNKRTNDEYIASGISDFMSTNFGRMINKIFSAAIISLIAKSIKSALDPTVAYNLITGMARDCDFIDMLITIGKKGLDFLVRLFPDKYTVHVQRAKDELDYIALDAKIKRALPIPPTTVIQRHYYDYAKTGLPGLLKDMDRYREVCQNLGKNIPTMFEAAYAKFKLCHQTAESRPLPFGIALVGPPGTGKSTMVQDIWEISKNVWNLETARSVSLNPDSAWDDPYNGEDFVLLDDIGVTKAEKTQVNPFERFLRVEQTHKNFSEQSEAQNKGAIPWAVKTICMTSNIDKLGVTTFVNNPIAILRRFHCYVEVYPNKDKYTFDFDSVGSDYYENEFRFEFKKVVPEYSEHQPLSNPLSNRLETVVVKHKRSEALMYIKHLLEKHVDCERHREALKDPICLACFVRPCSCLPERVFTDTSVGDPFFQVAEETQQVVCDMLDDIEMMREDRIHDGEPESKQGCGDLYVAEEVSRVLDDMVRDVAWKASLPTEQDLEMARGLVSRERPLKEDYVASMKKVRRGEEMVYDKDSVRRTLYAPNEVERKREIKIFHSGHPHKRNNEDTSQGARRLLDMFGKTNISYLEPTARRPQRIWQNPFRAQFKTNEEVSLEARQAIARARSDRRVEAESVNVPEIDHAEGPKHQETIISNDLRLREARQRACDARGLGADRMSVKFSEIGHKRGVPYWLLPDADVELSKFYLRMYTAGKLNDMQIPRVPELPATAAAIDILKTDDDAEVFEPQSDGHFSRFMTYFTIWACCTVPQISGVAASIIAAFRLYSFSVFLASAYALHTAFIVMCKDWRDKFFAFWFTFPAVLYHRMELFLAYMRYKTAIYSKPVHFRSINNHVRVLSAVAAMLVGISVIGLNIGLFSRMLVGLKKWRKQDATEEAVIEEPRAEIHSASGIAAHGLNRSKKRTVVVRLGSRSAYGYFLDSTHVMTVGHLFRGIEGDMPIYIQRLSGDNISFETTSSMRSVKVMENADVAYVSLKETSVRFGSLFDADQFVSDGNLSADKNYYCYDPARGSNYMLKFREMRTHALYKDSYGPILLPRGYIFDCPKKFTVGDCGIMVVDELGNNVGILVGTTEIDNSILVTPMLKASLSVVVHDVEVSPKIDGSLTDAVVLSPNGTPFGASVRIGEMRGMCGMTAASSAKKSLLSGVPLRVLGAVPDPTQFAQPSVFRGGSVRKNVDDTYIRNLKILKQPKSVMDMGILRRSIDDYFRRVKECLTEDDIQNIYPETYDNALRAMKNGLRVEELRPMKLHTAVGYPFSSGKKRDYVQFSEKGVEFDHKFKKYLDECEDMLLQGSTYFSVVKAQIKDEVVKESKTKTRLIYVGDTATYCLCRKYFWWLPLLVYRHPLEFECAYGVNPYSQEWRDIQDYLNIYDYHMAADFSDWDLRLPKELMDGAFEILQRLSSLGHGFPDEKFFSAFQPLFTSPVALFGVSLYNLESGTPSGHPFTYLFNSIANSIRARYCFYALFPHLSYDDHVRGIYGGDDAHETTNLPAYNQLTTLPIMLTLGIRPTDSSKNEVTRPFMDPGDVTFLKRNERGQIEVKTIHKLLTWTTSKDLIQHAYGSILSALFEIRMYGREHFDDFVTSLREHIGDVQAIHPANGVDLTGILHMREKFLHYDYDGYRFTSTLHNRRVEVYFDDKRVILHPDRERVGV